MNPENSPEITLPQHDSPLRAFSIETTFPTQSELQKLRDVLPPDILIYLSFPPHKSHLELVQVARQVRKVGFEPVPHIAARGYADRAALADFITRMTGEAGVRRALVIAGDVDRPAGPFASAHDVIESDLLQQNGIFDIGLSGYPDGHPNLSDSILWDALSNKLTSAASRDLKVHLVSQFAFGADVITKWIRSLRKSGIDVPIKIGLAGPASVKGLVRYAMRCGVRTSFRAMLSGKAPQLMEEMTPQKITDELLSDKDFAVLGDLSLHFYSFGGLVRTAQWARSY